jgi:hypothetical protein
MISREVTMRSFLLLLSCAAACFSATYTLADQWQVDFGRGQEQVVYRAAACPDGTFYLSDDSGRVATIDADGKVISRQLRSEFAGARMLACDAESNLYIAHQRQIAVMRAGSLIHRIATEVAISSFTPGPDGSVYVRGVRFGGDQPLHRIDRDGRVVKSFGASGPMSYLQSAGELLWQPDKNRLLFIPYGRSLEIHMFDAEGGYLGFYGKRTSRFIWPLRWDDPLGRAVAGARLAGGEIVIQRDGTFERGQPRTIQIYDSELGFVGSVGSDMKLLAGAAGEDGLYLVNLSSRRLQIFKVRLVKRLSL